MRQSTALSRFTPSLLSHETLKAIFVKRQRLVDRLVELNNLSSAAVSKHHILLVGPRGIGKTHLVSLVYHRLREFPDLESRQLIAWLREEEWGVSSYLDFLLRILRALSEEYKDNGLIEKIENLVELSPDYAEQTAETLITEKCKGKSLLLLVENLDEIFKGLEKNGQEKLRAYFQNNSYIAILAASQGLFNGVSLRNSPFYGFFEINHLQGLTFEDTVIMLTKIARYQGDESLATMISTPHGRARIRAVHHLAGGNPRLYVVFSQFLSRESLESLVDPLMQMLDDLTPYYQARMAHLTPQQRKIVEFLCDHRNAVTVKIIAKQNFLTHQTTSSQLKKLREMGYVRSHQSGRDSYYEVREPLMRLALELKKQRGGPIRLFVEFLKLWYSTEELVNQLKALSSGHTEENDYLNQALEAKRKSKDDPAVRACIDDYNIYINSNDYIHAKEVSEELIALRGNAWDWVKQAHCLQKLGEKSDSQLAIKEAINLLPDNSSILFDCAYIESELGLNEESLLHYEKVLEIDKDNSMAWNNRGAALNQLERETEAKESFRKALELIKPENHWGWRSKGLYEKNLGMFDEAIVSFEKAIKIAPNDIITWKWKSQCLKNSEQHIQAIESYEKLTELDPDDVSAKIDLATLQEKVGRHFEAAKTCADVLELEPKNAFIWAKQAVSYYYSGLINESLQSLENAVELAPDEAHFWANRAVALSALERHDEALASLDKSFDLQPDNIDFTRLSNYASILMTVGQWENGIQLLDDALAHLLNPDDGQYEEDIVIVGNLLIRTRDFDSWKRHISVWIELFGKYELYPILGKGLVHSIDVFSIPWINQAAMRSWNETWQNECEGIEELALPLRLLDTAVQYWERQDRRVLLELPSEERSILFPMLGLEDF
ncbi:MAG: tetratricopeptide repeat protein [Nitrosomonas sp.]|nr:tetratricopeptide repeat protein [Nitrosomonas sp.]